MEQSPRPQPSKSADGPESTSTVPNQSIAVPGAKHDKIPAGSGSAAPAERSQPRGTEPSPGRTDPSHVSDRAGGRGRGGRGGKKRDLGRSEWAKKKVDKRQRNEDEQSKREWAEKRRKVDMDGDEGRAEIENDKKGRDGGVLPIYATKFSDEVIKAEGRRPKKKVAVMIGYAGTGYRGMQLTHDQKTIEGDLFQAFVAAGAISKANADDPKKSSFVRCARTDKGVHAAGNIISLKLIIEEEDIVCKINENLAPQIRVWGYERTNNSFSAYQLCDSRIYEYLIPSHGFLPPHPSSWLGRKCEEWAERKDDVEKWKERQEEVRGWWEKIDAEIVEPILAEYDEEVQAIMRKALFLRSDEDAQDTNGDDDQVQLEQTDLAPPEEVTAKVESLQPTSGQSSSAHRIRSQTITEAIKRLRAAYTAAKRSYRIPPSRLERVKQALNLYVGTRNYHNYTIQKSFRDPSAKRVIKSFVANPTPILINGTEWLSLKVHGQSFMMHQIRKMVGMASLVVRCGCDPNRIVESYGSERISIPKAPSLGLLLERPVFDSYNKRAKGDLGKDAIDFDKFKTEMEEFKQREIYERMYRDEEKDNIFGNFFNHVDNFPSEAFLFVTSGGFEATKIKAGMNAANRETARNGLVGAGVDEDSDDESVTRDANGDEG